jgi:RES domain-containing protein
VNLTNCSALARRNVAATWYRATPPAHLARAIETSHTAMIPSRFSASALPRFEVLYLAENHQVALYEVEALLGPAKKPISNPAKPFVCLPVEVYLEDIADLTDPGQATMVNTNAQELTGDWRSFADRLVISPGGPHAGIAPTQQIGGELFNLGFKGLMSFSAKQPGAKILAVFTQRLLDPCWVRYNYDDDQGRRQTVQIP